VAGDDQHRAAPLARYQIAHRFHDWVKVPDLFGYLDEGRFRPLLVRHRRPFVLRQCDGRRRASLRWPERFPLGVETGSELLPIPSPRPRDFELGAVLGERYARHAEFRSDCGDRFRPHDVVELLASEGDAEGHGGKIVDRATRYFESRTRRARAPRTSSKAMSHAALATIACASQWLTTRSRPVPDRSHRARETWDGMPDEIFGR
jgi:hypothetical protein